MNKLAEREFVTLPPQRPGGGRQILRALSEPELFSLSAGAGESIEGPLRALQPLEMIPVEPRTTQANAFVWHLGQHHYLGYGGAAGQNLRYLIRDCYRRDLACLLFGGAAWKVKARDGFIGWSAQLPAFTSPLTSHFSPFSRASQEPTYLLAASLARFPTCFGSNVNTGNRFRRLSDVGVLALLLPKRTKRGLLRRREKLLYKEG